MPVSPPRGSSSHPLNARTACLPSISAPPRTVQVMDRNERAEALAHIPADEAQRIAERLADGTQGEVGDIMAHAVDGRAAKRSISEKSWTPSGLAPDAITIRTGEQRIVVPPALWYLADSTAEPFRLEPLGPQHNVADFSAWTASIDHIQATPGFTGSGWPHSMGLADNLRDLNATQRTSRTAAALPTPCWRRAPATSPVVRHLPAARRQPG